MSEDIAIMFAEALKEVHSGQMNEFIDLAIQALEKQIPKKPVLVDRPFACVKVRVCPSCSIPENYYPLFSKVNYCTNCGQKLDWSENNEID